MSRLVSLARNRVSDPHDRWLVRRGRREDAKKALLRLTSLNRETDFDADETVSMMVHTTALEEQITRGASYFDCFKGSDLRRTEVSRVSKLLVS